MNAMFVRSRTNTVPPSPRGDEVGAVEVSPSSRRHVKKERRNLVTTNRSFSSNNQSDNDNEVVTKGPNRMRCFSFSNNLAKQSENDPVSTKSSSKSPISSNRRVVRATSADLVDEKNEKSLGDLHAELKHLAATDDDVAVDGGVKRHLLKGKKLVRVKRVPARAASTSTAETETENANAERKILRVKVKRKKTKEPLQANSESNGDVDSMAPRRGVGRAFSGSGSRRRNKSDASVGTGVFSKAKSWFTFGGLKLGSSGKDFLGMENEDDEDDCFTQAHDDGTDYDEVTMDVRTANDEATTKEEPITSRSRLSSMTASYALKAVGTEPTSAQQKRSSPVSPSSAYKEKVVNCHPRSPTTPKSDQASSSRGRRQIKCPTQDIIYNPIPPKKQPLTGVALRRLQIQEQWLSAGCNYKPNEFLRATSNKNNNEEENGALDISEISFDEPILLVVGPDAPANGEVDFWTRTTQSNERIFGETHFRTTEAILNRGVAELNARHITNAIDSFNKAVNLMQDLHEESSLAAARGLHLLGSAFFLQGQLPLAVDATRKALDIRKAVLGCFHTDTVDTFSNLAMIYLKMNKLLEAARIFNEVLIIRKAVYDDFHPSVAFPTRSLACVYAKRREKERARQAYWHALRCFKRHNMFPEHMDTEAEMRRFGIDPPVEHDKDSGRLEI